MILIGRGLDLRGSVEEEEEKSERSKTCAVLKVRRAEVRRANSRRRGSRNRSSKHKISGDNSLRDPPVPIPNTEVKPQHADSTWVVTPREGRSSPDSMRTVV